MENLGVTHPTPLLTMLAIKKSLLWKIPLVLCQCPRWRVFGQVLNSNVGVDKANSRAASNNPHDVLFVFPQGNEGG